MVLVEFLVDLQNISLQNVSLQNISLQNVSASKHISNIKFQLQNVSSKKRINKKTYHLQNVSSYNLFYNLLLICIQIFFQTNFSFNGLAQVYIMGAECCSQSRLGGGALRLEQDRGPRTAALFCSDKFGRSTEFVLHEIDICQVNINYQLLPWYDFI